MLFSWTCKQRPQQHRSRLFIQVTTTGFWSKLQINTATQLPAFGWGFSQSNTTAFITQQSCFSAVTFLRGSLHLRETGWAAACCLMHSLLQKCLLCRTLAQSRSALVSNLLACPHCSKAVSAEQCRSSAPSLLSTTARHTVTLPASTAWTH